MAGCLIAALTYFPLFGALTTTSTPHLEAFQAKTKITVTADPAQCNFHIFVGPWSKFTECDRAKDTLTKSGLSFTSVNAPAGIAGRHLDQRQEARRASTPRKARRKLAAALKEAGYSADRRQVEGQLVHGRGDPGDHARLRHHGLRTDRGLPGRALPDQHPLHLDVAALSHRQRLVRRHAAPAGDRAGRLVGRHLLRPLVPDRRRRDDAGDRHRSSCEETKDVDITK